MGRPEQRDSECGLSVLSVYGSTWVSGACALVTDVMLYVFLTLVGDVLALSDGG